jgi:hypothetical protein
MMQEPIVYSTLGDLRQGTFRISAWCRECNREEWVKIDGLIRRLGEAYPYTTGLALVCSRCRSRNVGVTIHPPAERGPISRGSV